MTTETIPVPEVARVRLGTLLAAREQAHRELLLFVSGVLAAQGIDEARLVGVDQARMAIILTAVEGSDAPG